MITCEGCGKSNSLDSLFCRACGIAIADAVILEARAENEKLIQEGYRLLGDNRQQEAMLVAETALRHDPASAAALSLLGDCCEQVGRYAEALDCYERLLEQMPDSTLDRIKVQHLRRRLSERETRTEPRGKRIALLGALAAVMMVGSIGAVLAFTQGADASTKSQSGSLAGGDKTIDTPTEGFGVMNAANDAQSDALSQESTQPNNLNKDVPDPRTAPTDNGSREPERRTTNNLARGGGRPLPDITSNGGMSLVGPLKPFGDIDIVPEITNTSKNKTNPDDVDPNPDRGSGSNSKGSDTVAKASPPPDDPGIIEIRSAGEPTIQRGGGEVLKDDVKSEALIRSAKNDLQVGDASRAASGFEKALASGAPAGTTNQHLGRAYERMGKASEAIAAYRQSISAYERDLKSGKGDPQRLRAAIDACKQAIRVLQGK